MAGLGQQEADQSWDSLPSSTLESVQEVADSHIGSDSDSTSTSALNGSTNKDVISINNDNGLVCQTDKNILVTFSGRGTEAKVLSGSSASAPGASPSQGSASSQGSSPSREPTISHSPDSATDPLPHSQLSGPADSSQPRPSKATGTTPRPPRPQVPQRTVSLPVSSSGTFSRAASSKEPQKTVATSRRNKVSQVRDKV